MVGLYHLPELAVNSMAAPISGNYLARNHLDRAARAFVAADLHSGAKHLVAPTMMQAAYLARVNVTYAWWAKKREAERVPIEAGFVPLVPARPIAPMTGHAFSVPDGIDDSAIVDFVRSVGVSRVIDAAVAVEAAQ